MKRKEIIAVLEAAGFNGADSTREDGVQGLTAHRDGSYTVRDGYFYGGRQKLTALRAVVERAGFEIIEAHDNLRAWPITSTVDVRFRIPT
jgi:hypothetical protein